ncbi:hypothetical protein D3C86_897430 [compost metagenome]
MATVLLVKKVFCFVFPIDSTYKSGLMETGPMLKSALFLSRWTLKISSPVRDRTEISIGVMVFILPFITKPSLALAVNTDKRSPKAKKILRIIYLKLKRELFGYRNLKSISYSLQINTITIVIVLNHGIIFPFDYSSRIFHRTQYPLGRSICSSGSRIC